MKTITIDTGATWPGGTPTIRSIQNGDELREEVVYDPISQDIADRLGYLKGTVDTKAGAASNMTWTGTHAFTGASVSLTPTGVTIAPVSGQTDLTGDLVATGTVDGANFSTGGVVVADDGVATPSLVLSDADQTVAHTTASGFRVPTLTANRIYTISNPGTDGIVVTFTRPGSAAYTATIRRADTTTLAVINASNQAAVSLRAIGGKWVVEMWTANVSSINSDVS